MELLKRLIDKKTTKLIDRGVITNCGEDLNYNNKYVEQAILDLIKDKVLELIAIDEEVEKKSK